MESADRKLPDVPLWRGEGRAPITLHTFLHCFFSFQYVSRTEKVSRNDLGARFGTFDFNYRWASRAERILAHAGPRHALPKPALEEFLKFL